MKARILKDGGTRALPVKGEEESQASGGTGHAGRVGVGILIESRSALCFFLSTFRPFFPLDLSSFSAKEFLGRSHPDEDAEEKKRQKGNE